MSAASDIAVDAATRARFRFRTWSPPDREFDLSDLADLVAQLEGLVYIGSIIAGHQSGERDAVGARPWTMRMRVERIRYNSPLEVVLAAYGVGASALTAAVVFARRLIDLRDRLTESQLMDAAAEVICEQLAGLEVSPQRAELAWKVLADKFQADRVPRTDPDDVRSVIPVAITVAIGNLEDVDLLDGASE